MQRIYFDKLTSWPNALLIFTAVICIGIGLWCVSDVTNYNWTRHLSTLGHVLLVIFFGKMFVRRNYVGWNRNWMTIRIKSFLGKTIRLPEVKEAFLDQDILFITMKNRDQTGITVSGIDETDIKKLTTLINSLIPKS